MVDPALVYSLVPLAVGLVCLCLGIFVLIKRDDQRISQTYMVTMCMILMNCAAQFLLANAPDGDSAESFGQVLFFTGILLSAAFLVMAVDLAFDLRKSGYMEKKYHFFGIVLALAVVSAVIAGPFQTGAYGFWPQPSYALLAWVAMMGALAALPVSMLIGLSERPGEQGAQQSTSMVALAAMVPFLLLSFDMFMVWSKIEVMHLMSVGMLLSALIFGHVIYTAPLTSPKPAEAEAVEEVEPTKEVNIKLASGRCDLIKSKKVDLSYRMFVSEIAAGSKGLLITRVHPDQVRERYGLVKTPILWLSGQPGPDRLDPASLSLVQHTMIEFLQNSPQSVILLDGLEYLATENQVDKVLRLIYSVHDAVVITGSKFLVPIDPQILSPKDMALFEREFYVIEDALPR